MKLLRWLLFPVSALYGWLMDFRNHLYNIGRKPEVGFDRAIISVGNLSMGGTGKTPMVEYLIELLKNDFRLATLSRGYGRKTSGYRMADTTDTAETLGDEPLQYYKKFGDEISVVVGEERILAIPSAIMEKEEIELFLLDDAFQHRKVARDFNILLSDYNKPFYRDFILPTGELREGRKGAKRADCIIITKCPIHISLEEKKAIERQVKVYSGEKPIYFSHIEYDVPKSIFDSQIDLYDGEEVIMLTGIAEPSLFKTELCRKYELKHEFVFEDHHRFKSKDLDDIYEVLVEAGDSSAKVLTTEKDMVRLLPFEAHPLFQSFGVYYLPIRFAIEGEQDFRNRLLKVIEQKKNLG